MSGIPEAQRQGLQRLNYKVPQYPTDLFCIKQDPNLLQQHLENSSLTQDLKERATPRQCMRMELFKISDTDMEKHRERAFVDRSISRFDPYFERLNQLRKREYKYLHPGV